MLFIHTIDKVLSGEKTQTRRLAQAKYAGSYSEGAWFAVYNTITAYPIWQVGRDYAVCPGRGKSQVARIRITGIRNEDVRSISDEDVIAEGFTDKFEFMRLWISMHDKELHKAQYWGLESIKSRPITFYYSWALTFELCK